MNLRINNDEGIAYQVDRDKPIQYNVKYHQKLNAYRKNTEMHSKINNARYELVKQYVPEWKAIIDIGCGNCDFLNTVNKGFIMAYGYEVIPAAVKELKEIGSYIDIYEKDALKEIYAASMWDVLEHLKDPKAVLDLLPPMCTLFISIPIYKNFIGLEKSKHFRPNEHFWYFTHNGFVSYMDGWQLLEYNDRETELGREDIRTYVFRKRSK